MAGSSCSLPGAAMDSELAAGSGCNKHGTGGQSCHYCRRSHVIASSQDDTRAIDRRNCARASGGRHRAAARLARRRIVAAGWISGARAHHDGQSGSGRILLISDEVESPVTFGWRDPVILLPTHFPSLPDEMREAVLCHELLHVARRDWLFTVMKKNWSAQCCGFTRLSGG